MEHVVFLGRSLRVGEGLVLCAEQIKAMINGKERVTVRAYVQTPINEVDLSREKRSQVEDGEVTHFFLLKKFRGDRGFVVIDDRTLEPRPNKDIKRRAKKIEAKRLRGKFYKPPGE